MESLFHGLPFHRILCGVTQAIWGCPQGRGATLREEGLEAKLELCFFSEVECIYLGVRRGRLSVTTGEMGTRQALPFLDHARA